MSAFDHRKWILEETGVDVSKASGAEGMVSSGANDWLTLVTMSIVSICSQSDYRH